jgi:hypothetical protein
MTLPIIEQPLYGEMLIETSPWATPFVWTDRTASLVAGFNYSQGGRVGPPGSSQVDVGTLNATFKDLASVPAVGALVRISFSKFAGYAFVGYVQDVSQRIVFDNSISLSTPVTLTTLHCSDWAGYISQFQAVGVGGSHPTTGIDETTSYYPYVYRAAALNKIIDPAFSTKMIMANSTGAGRYMGDTDFVANFSEHLDLMCVTGQAFWYPRNVIPTNITTGRDGLVEITQTLNSSGKTFTDLVGSAGQLHYTEIDIENSTQNVANTVVLNNRTRINIADIEVTKIGGFNEQNFVVINNTNVVGVGLDRVQKNSDTTSITTYGNRQSQFQTNVGSEVVGSSFNLVTNPSMEYSDDGYSGLNAKVRRRKPSEDPTPFAAYNGLWAMRARQSTAITNCRITFSGGESDGIPVVAGTTYYIKGYALRGTPSRTDTRASMTIDWYNDDETIISSSATSDVSLTTANTWYLVSGSGVAPAGAVRVIFRMTFSRTGGGNISVGDRMWGDAFSFSKANDTYFDGDTKWNSAYGYFWTGGVGSSPSGKIGNWVDNLSSTILTKYSTTSLRVSRIRWNAQENLASIPALSVGKTISLVYKGTTTTYRIIGIDGNVDPERYMIDYYLVKV